MKLSPGKWWTSGLQCLPRAEQGAGWCETGQLESTVATATTASLLSAYYIPDSLHSRSHLILLLTILWGWCYYFPLILQREKLRLGRGEWPQLLVVEPRFKSRSVWSQGWISDHHTVTCKPRTRHPAVVHASEAWGENVPRCQPRGGAAKTEKQNRMWILGSWEPRGF